MTISTGQKTPGLDRREVVAALLENRTDTVVVSGLGAATYDVAAAGDHVRNFYLWGAMGSAAMIGLGIALARPDVPVVVITGDGEMLMGLGSFAVVGRSRPANLSIVVLDNELYGETGAQPTHTASNVDLAAVARAAGIENATVITSHDALDSLSGRIHSCSEGPTVATVKISGDEHHKVIPLRDGAVNKARLRIELGFTVD